MDVSTIEQPSATIETPAPARCGRFYCAAIAAILILAAALRVYHIDRDSIWGDETCTIMIARMPIPQLIHTNIWWEQIPPLHHLVIHFWDKIFPDTAFWVRMPSAIAGVAGVWMMFVLVRRLLDARAGLCAALLMAVSPMHIAYSQECRSYTLAVLLCLISLDLFVRLLRTPSQRLHFWWVIVTALSFWAHLYCIFTVFAQHVVYFAMLWRERRALPLRPKNWIIDNVATAALFSPWVPTVVLWTRSVAVNFWVKKASIHDISKSYWIFSGSVLVYVFMIALTVVGVAYWRKRRGFGVLVLLAILLSPVVVPDVVSVLTRPSYAPRYGIMGSVGMCALAGAGIAALPRGLALVVLAVVAIASPMGDAAAIPKADWRDAGAFLQQNMRPNDIAVIHCSAGIRLYKYYVHRPDVAPHPVDTASLPISLPIDPPGRRVWLVIYDPWRTPNEFLAKCPLRIERRFFSWGVLVLELTDEGTPLAATQPTTAPN